MLFVQLLFEKVNDHLDQKEDLIDDHPPEIARECLDSVNHEVGVLERGYQTDDQQDQIPYFEVDRVLLDRVLVPFLRVLLQGCDLVP